MAVTSAVCGPAGPSAHDGRAAIACRWVSVGDGDRRVGGRIIGEVQCHSRGCAWLRRFRMSLSHPPLGMGRLLRALGRRRGPACAPRALALGPPWAQCVAIAVLPLQGG